MEGATIHGINSSISTTSLALCTFICSIYLKSVLHIEATCMYTTPIYNCYKVEYSC